MAITTIDGLIAGFKPMYLGFKALTGATVAGRAVSLWGLAGMPGAGSYDTTLNGVTLSSTSAQVPGQIPFDDPVSGNTYLANFWSVGSSTGSVTVCDRLWHNGGITITSTGSQSITSPTWPARDVDGATDGAGVLLGVEVSAQTGAGTPTITVGYTNSAGTSGRTATNIFATAASSLARTFYLIGLQAGDRGVRSVQSIQLSATWTSGTINLVAYCPLLTANSAAPSIAGQVDPLSGGLPRMYDGSVPFLMLRPTSTTTTSILYGYQVAQG